MNLSRRDTLLGTAALAAAPLVTSAEVKAAAPVADKQAPSYYRYKVGDIVVTVVSDGKNVFPLTDAFITNAKKDEVSAALEKAFMPHGMMAIYFAPLVIQTGGKLVVIDTGNGALAKTNSKGNNGLFHDNMAAAGFDAKAVDTVVISHFHGDHVNGLLTADGTPAFPNAEVLVPATEWKFWMDDGEMSRAKGDRMVGLFKNNRNIFENGLKKKVTPYEWNKEVAPGLTARMPRNIASRVTSTRRCAFTEGLPATYMRLVSPWKPSLMTVTSILMMSPSLRILASLGMPWQMTLLTEVQTLAGKPL